MSPPRRVDERRRLIWRAVRAIPRGRVAAYGDIARWVGAGVTARLVGRALPEAPPGARLPWHRVMGAGGRVALPGEAGAEQRLRLEFEGVRFRGRRAAWAEFAWRPDMLELDRLRSDLEPSPRRGRAAS